MKPGKAVSNVAGWALGLYLMVYAGLSIVALADYTTRTRPPYIRILKVEAYKVKVKGRVKCFVLAGENHDYNQQEYQTGKKLVEAFPHVAAEGFRADSLSLRNRLYAKTLVPYQIQGHFYKLGSGRQHGSIFHIAKSSGKDVHELEAPDEAFDAMDTGEKLLLFGTGILGMITGPLNYFQATLTDIKFLDYAKRVEGGETEVPNFVSKRDKRMASRVLDLLTRDEIDALLASVGRAHFAGVEKNLSGEVKMEKTTACLPLDM